MFKKILFVVAFAAVSVVLSASGGGEVSVATRSLANSAAIGGCAEGAPASRSLVSTSAVDRVINASGTRCSDG